MRRRIILLLAVAGLVTAFAVPAVAAEEELATYEVTITNLAATQPVSPPVVTTHHPRNGLFAVGHAASSGIEAIAEDGNQSVAFAALTASPHVTDVVDVGMPLTPSGVVVGDFSDTATITISGRVGDDLSLAGMLICTNDGFSGLDGVDLPRRGAATYYTAAYDAGTELNTELSSDIVDPCSGLGPVALAGDPNGNNNAGIDEGGVVTHHAGVAGTGDLLDAHNWDGPILMVTVERVG